MKKKRIKTQISDIDDLINDDTFNVNGWAPSGEVQNLRCM